MTTNGVIYKTVSAICVTICITMCDYMFYSLHLPNLKYLWNTEQKISISMSLFSFLSLIPKVYFAKHWVHATDLAILWKSAIRYAHLKRKSILDSAFPKLTHVVKTGDWFWKYWWENKGFFWFWRFELLKFPKSTRFQTSKSLLEVLNSNFIWHVIFINFFFSKKLYISLT